MTSDSVHLSDVANIQGGFAFKSSDFQSEGVAVVKIANIQPPFVSLSNVDRVANEKLTTLDRFRLNDGDIIMAMTGATVGKVGRFKETEPAYLNQRVARINAKRGPQFDDFIYAIVSQPRFDELIEGASAGSAQANISAAGIGSVLIPHISDADQLVIGETARSIDDRITLLRETNKTLEAIAQALFKSWFVDFDPVRAKAEGGLPEGIDAATAALFPDAFDETELGMVPKGWLVSRIGDISAVIDCLHSKKPELIESEFPFLQLSNIRDDGLLDTSEVKGVSESDYIKWSSRIEVSGGDCVITNVGRVGAVAQIPEGFKAAMGRNMTAIRLSSDLPYPTYLIELLQSSWMQTEISAKTDVGTILNALNVKSIPQLRCVVADSFVMSAFESIARPLRNTMEQNLFTIHTLSNLRDTLLPRLISGQLRITDAEAEIEKVSA